MQTLMCGILILGFVSTTFCLNSNTETKIKCFNVMDYGAHADGKTDDSNSLVFQSCNGLTVKSLSMSNSPEAHIAVNGCDGALFSHININSPPKSPNTDGFDIANSKNIVIQDSTLATGDDCIAINGGSSFINATRLLCKGGHGISIGSLGRNKSYETVEEGGSGYARKITFEDIMLQDVQNSIIIDQY
ncbi:hypothetical protein LR48_Vigan11g154300 [Vigna angularis]|uniref:Pectate lyase domain-containing protein n=1 Tax=Phaseolus angularis TaxID=3914 RepID=A0A0L9VUR5_PHAAN|nr:hypothetical protein LR48_Vigan11g154300 [Vigna angularis]